MEYTKEEDRAGVDHPCAGCLHFYGAYDNNVCCNYIFDEGKLRPCPPGAKCTVKRPITCKADLKLRKAVGLGPMTGLFGRIV